jgi:hypothetical protein
MKRGDRKKIFIMDRFSLWWHRKNKDERQLIEAFLTNPIRQERNGRQIFFLGVFGLVGHLVYWAIIIVGAILGIW